MQTRQFSKLKELVLTPAGAGIALVSWPASSYAESYRVVWRLAGGGPSTQAGLVADLQHALTGLPSGVPIIVGVSARNSSGETAPTEATIIAP